MVVLASSSMYVGDSIAFIRGHSVVSAAVDPPADPHDTALLDSFSGFCG
jgi:hypothetical protein